MGFSAPALSRFCGGLQAPEAVLGGRPLYKIVKGHTKVSP
jgi:hypothetical protein